MEAETAKDRAERYIALTEQALRSLHPSTESENAAQQAGEVLDTASRYLSDSKYFCSKGDFISALSTVNYAHGWIDAGKKLGVLMEENRKH